MIITKQSYTIMACDTYEFIDENNEYTEHIDEAMLYSNLSNAKADLQVGHIILEVNSTYNILPAEDNNGL